MTGLLSDFDKAKLASSGISPAVIEQRGYRTIDRKDELLAYGFSPSQCKNLPVMLIPVTAPDGTNGLYVSRPEFPREIAGRKLKYELPKGTSPRIDCPKGSHKDIGNPSVPLWVTEAPLKADALLSHGLCSVALLGVNSTKTTNEFGGKVTSVDFDSIAWNGRAVFIVFDSDVTTNPHVKKALDKMHEIASRRGASVTIIYLPNNDDDTKVGVDDYLMTHSVEELLALADAKPPTIEPKAPAYEILDEAPPTMTRPLQIIEGRAYAATWATVRCTKTEDVDKNGKLIRFPVAQVTDTKQLIIVRDDGVTFGMACDEPIDAIGFAVDLREELTDGVMNAAAIRRYRANEKIDIANVFERIVDIFDHFLDYADSLAPQRTMCELMACFVIATYFLESVDSAGYIYCTGGLGSGKSQNLKVTCRLAFLGQFVQAAGSFAAIRDMSDYGAFLGFDDAENVSSKDFDPDKRTILLSGSTRGSTVSLKEPGPDRVWKTRHVNTFAYRGFSAIRDPDGVLGSRAITVPLVRTDNKAKGTASASDDEAWPHDRKRLIADLWCVSLRRLVEMRKAVPAAKADARLIGRQLEPWIGVLAVAKLIGPELYKRMEQLSVDYQGARSDLEAGNLTPVIIRAIVRTSFPDIEEPFDFRRIQASEKREWKVATSAITEAVTQLVEQEELDFNVEYINARRIGRELKKLRLTAKRDGKSRNWLVTLGWMEKNLRAYSLTRRSSDVSDVSDISDVNREISKFYNNDTLLSSTESVTKAGSPVQCHPDNVTSVTNVTNVTPNHIAISGQTNGRGYGICPCGMTAYIGKDCPRCGVPALAKSMEVGA